MISPPWGKIALGADGLEVWVLSSQFSENGGTSGNMHLLNSYHLIGKRIEILYLLFIDIDRTCLIKSLPQSKFIYFKLKHEFPILLAVEALGPQRNACA